MRSLVPARVCALIVALGSASALGQGMVPAPSLRGFSGILDTPNALVLEDGNASFWLSNEKDPRFRSSSNTNFFLTLGFLPFVEVSGRFSEIRPGARDLSANAKLELPFQLLNRWLPALGLGVTDLGSSVAYFRSKYAVLTETVPYARLSVGYGLGPDQLDGAFAGLELLPTSWAGLLAEYDSKEWNAGARLSLPVSLDGVPLRLEGLAKTSLSYRPGHFEFAAGIQIPLSFHVPGDASTPDISSPHPDPLPPEGEGNLAPIGQLTQITDALVTLGFENVRVGLLPPHTLFIQVENNVFNHNDLDALGVILGTAAQLAPAEVDTVTLQLRKTNLPLYEVSAPRAALAGFLLGSAPAAPLHLTVHTRLTDTSRVAFAGPRRNSTFLHTQLILAPKLTTFVGTEVGPFDAVFALRPELVTQLWPGAALDVRFEIPVLWTANFDNGGALRPLRPDPRLENALLYQGLRLAPGLYLLAGAGLFQSSAGGLGELSWLSSDGHHRLSVQGGLTAPRNGVQVESALASYRYHFTPLELTAGIAAGRFLNGDQGFQVSLGRDFRDTRVSFFYTHTSYQEVGIAFALPLTPRRDLRPGYLQLKGTSRWHFRETTTVGHLGSNPLHPGLGLSPESGYTLEDVYLNGDRFGEAYLNAHLERLREAFLRWNLPFQGEPRID